MSIESKIITGLERLSEVFKSLLWEKAKAHGISPIQIQILLFVAKHNPDLSNVSYLAKELGVTKPTVSDAVRVLLKKMLLEKDFSPVDNRRYNLLITPRGKEIVQDLSNYTQSLTASFSHIDPKDLIQFYKTLTTLIFQLNQKGIIQVQRTCFNCKFYKGNQQGQHFCSYLDTKLTDHELRLDCNEFEELGL